MDDYHVKKSVLTINDLKQNRFWGLASYLAQPDLSVSCWRHKRYAICRKDGTKRKKVSGDLRATVYGRLGLAFENKG